MTDLWLVLFPLLLTDIANPVLFALLVYLAGGSHGVRLSMAALAGHTAAYFASGVVLALAWDQLTAFIANPGPISYGIGLLLGGLLLWVAWLSRGDGSTPESAEEPPASVGSAFVTGAIINFIGVPFALPYFAVIDQILKSDPGVGQSLLLLGAYNLAYMTPFLIVPLLTIVMGESAQALLQRINRKVESVAGILLPLILGIVGMALVIDAVLFFTTGKGLY